MIAWLLLFSIYIFFHSNYALIPQICLRNVTQSRICCPVNNAYGTPCGYPFRGMCEEIQHPNEYIPDIFQIDERVYWPSKFIQWHCRCIHNYFGLACEECKYGWTGTNCDRQITLIRRNILSYSPRERDILNRVIGLSLATNSGYVIPVEMNNLLSDPLINPIWLHVSTQYKKVFDHRFAGRNTLFNSDTDCRLYGSLLDFNHNGLGFATWHRYFLLNWERELGKIAQRHFGIRNFALPYWDWTDLKYCDICRNDLVGSPGYEDRYGTRIDINSIFYNWTEFCMEPTNPTICYGCHVAGTLGKLTRRWNNLDFPSLEEIQYTLGIPDFYTNNNLECDSFNRALEGFCGRRGPLSTTSDAGMFMHNKVHNMVDGSMCCSATSANDPLFLFHHTQIDRIFQAWFDIHKPDLNQYPEKSGRPGHNRDSYLVSSFPLVKHQDMFIDINNLGYKYDSYDFSLNRRQSTD